MNKEAPKPKLYLLACDNRAGKTAVDASAAGVLDTESNTGDPIGSEEDQAKAECR